MSAGADGLTYFVIWRDGGPIIVCRLCGASSALPADVHNAYCARCHVFHALVAQARAGHADGAGHECGEWRTAAGACAVCGRPLEARARGG